MRIRECIGVQAEGNWFAENLSRKVGNDTFFWTDS